MHFSDVNTLGEKRIRLEEAKKIGPVGRDGEKKRRPYTMIALSDIGVTLKWRSEDEVIVMCFWVEQV